MEAWRAAGTGARLLRAVTTQSFATRFADLHRRIGVYGPGYPVVTSDEDAAVLVHFDGGMLDRKVAALRAQASQTAGLIEAVRPGDLRRLVRRGGFCRGILTR